MKKFFMLTIFLLFSLCLLTYKFYKEDIIEEVPTKNIKHSSMLSMMLETKAGSGKYEMTTSSSWPTDGYVFNSELSKCENGSTLSWDDANKQVVFNGDITDKCYVFFDKGFTLTSFVISQYTGTQGENNIYYHDSNLTNGAGDNSYRYSSKSAKNYVCFGTDDTTCPKDNLYRIIGLFGGNIKLVKNDYAGSDLLGTNGNYGGQATIEEKVGYLGNKKPLEKYNFGSNNTWSSSKLNTINLNTNFINNIGNKWSNMIISAVWKVGGNTSTNILNNSVRTVFTNEIKNPVNNTYTAKIGLMYVSDFGYASVASRWTTMMEESSSGHANIDNYLFLRFNDWTITPNSGNSNNVYATQSEGIVTTASVNEAYGIRPAFYLKDSVMYVSGTGTISDPIRVIEAQ